MASTWVMDAGGPKGPPPTLSGIPAMGNTGVINSSGMALGRDGISCGSSHASILEQFGAVQPVSSAFGTNMAQPGSNMSPRSLAGGLSVNGAFGQQQPLSSYPSSLGGDRPARPGSAGSHHSLASMPSMPNLLNQPVPGARATDLTMLQLQQQLQGLSMAPHAMPNVKQQQQMPVGSNALHTSMAGGLLPTILPHQSMPLDFSTLNKPVGGGILQQHQPPGGINNQFAVAQALARLQMQQQQQQQQLLLAQQQLLQAAQVQGLQQGMPQGMQGLQQGLQQQQQQALANNLTAMQINALRQNLAAKNLQKAAQQRQQAMAAIQGANFGGATNSAHNAAVIAEASRLAAVRAQQQQQQLLLQAIQTNGGGNGLNNAAVQALLAQQQHQQQQQQSASRNPAAIPQFNPPLVPTQPPAALRPAQDASYKDKLVEMGVGLAQNNISIETAVNSGLLGGLSAADVRVLATAHAAETRRQQQQQQASSAAQFAGGVHGNGNGAMGGNAVASQGLGLLGQNGLQASSALPSSMPPMSSMPLNNNNNNHNAALSDPPLALFDASKLGTSFGTTSSVGGTATSNNPLDLSPPSALQQPVFFSFFGVDSNEHGSGLTMHEGVNALENNRNGVQQDADTKSTNNDATTTGGSHATNTSITEPPLSTFDASTYAFFGRVDTNDTLENNTNSDQQQSNLIHHDNLQMTHAVEGQSASVLVGNTTTAHNNTMHDNVHNISTTLFNNNNNSLVSHPFSSDFDYSLQAAVQRALPVGSSHMGGPPVADAAHPPPTSS